MTGRDVVESLEGVGLWMGISCVWRDWVNLRMSVGVGL